ncbi:hypothetical protein C8J56DRAFT_94875 [Mycena floridula]|nr:hypothetical protein C8J56DRAFT_94875 [Mycena floridula]
MVLRFITQCFSSCFSHAEPDTINESSHLIPHSPDAHTSSSSNSQRLKDKLGTIVRTTEGKMVNVSSQIPFRIAYHERASVAFGTVHTGPLNVTRSRPTMSTSRSKSNSSSSANMTSSPNEGTAKLSSFNLNDPELLALSWSDQGKR